jgi:parallel beta-helix repeat protein
MNRYRNTLFLLLFLTPLAWAADIYQTDIPLIIKKPGTYFLKENIVYKHSDAAIIIKANNVVLNFETFSLTLSKHKATGILVENASEFVIIGDTIINTSSRKQQGHGIKIVKSNIGLIQNSFTIRNRNGLFIKKSNGIQVQNSDFSHAAQSGALVQESTIVAFDNCVFADNNNGLTLSGANKDILITNSSFPSSTFSNLNVQQVDGMIVDNCSFTNIGGASTKLNLVQFGDANPEQACNDVIFSNCTIINRPAHLPTLGNTAPEGLGIYQGSGFLVDSCVIDIDNTNQDPDADLSGIHISNPGLGINGTIASNVIVRNCIIQGPATDGLYPDIGSSGVVLENNLVTGALKDGIFLAGTTASTVVGNTVVNNGTNGIFVGEVSSSNAIIDNVVNNNGFNPISASLPPIGNGIAIASDSPMNTVQGNTVFNNAIYGIDDQGANNQIIGNIAYANATNNYHTAIGVIIVSTAGAATLTGANISA